MVQKSSVNRTSLNDLSFAKNIVTG